jgi:acyl-coenzyme A synthetase/AMP-(fatty) acid ligase
MVADCAVIGVYDPEQATELPRGYIVLQSGVPKNESTANEIKKFVAEQVVHYKQLRSVVFIDEIPKSASGKILRRILRDAAEKEQQEKTQRSKL